MGRQPVGRGRHPADRARLVNAGINLLQSVRIAPKFAASPRTLASGSAAVSDWRYLSPRRLALFVMTRIERGTRWMLFERNAPPTWAMAMAVCTSLRTSVATCTGPTKSCTS